MAGKAAYGVTLERSDMAATPTFTPIGNITEPSGPEMERETIDTTAHDSPSGYREFIGSLVDPGELTITVNYDSSKHDTLVEDFEDVDARDYRLTWPQGSTWAISAFLTGFSPEGAVDDKLSAELTFKVTSKPAITPAA